MEESRTRLNERQRGEWRQSCFSSSLRLPSKRAAAIRCPDNNGASAVMRRSSSPFGPPAAQSIRPKLFSALRADYMAPLMDKAGRLL